MNDIIRTEVQLINVPAMIGSSGNVVNPVRRIGMFILTQKKCTKCGEVKDRGEFNVAKLGRDGLRTDCKVCQRKRNTIWRQEHPDTMKACKDSWKERHPTYGADYYYKNIDRLTEQGKQWRKQRPDKVTEYYLAHLRHLN